MFEVALYFPMSMKQREIGKKKKKWKKEERKEATPSSNSISASSSCFWLCLRSLRMILFPSCAPEAAATASAPQNCLSLEPCSPRRLLCHSHLCFGLRRVSLSRLLSWSIASAPAWCSLRSCFPQLLNGSGPESCIILPDLLFRSLGDAFSVLPPWVFFSQEGPMELFMCNGLINLWKAVPFPSVPHARLAFLLDLFPLTLSLFSGSDVSFFLTQREKWSQCFLGLPKAIIVQTNVACCHLSSHSKSIFQLNWKSNPGPYSDCHTLASIPFSVSFSPCPSWRPNSVSWSVPSRTQATPPITVNVLLWNSPNHTLNTYANLPRLHLWTSSNWMEALPIFTWWFPVLVSA